MGAYQVSEGQGARVITCKYCGEPKQTIEESCFDCLDRDILARDAASDSMDLWDWNFLNLIADHGWKEAVILIAINEPLNIDFYRAPE